MVLPRVGLKVKLVPFRAEYAEAYFRWYYDAQYQAYFRAFPDVPLTRKDFDRFDEFMVRGGVQSFVVVDKESGAAIGSMSYACLKPKAGVYIFGIMLDSAHQNKTTAIECIILLAFFLYNHKGCNKLVVEFLADNKQIQRITEKGGFTREAVLKKESVINGQYVDEVRYFIFKDTAYELYGSYYESLMELTENRAST